MGGSRGVRTPLPAESALFVEECNFQTKNFTQKKHSFIAQNQNFPRKGTRSLHKTKIFPRKDTRSLHKTKIFPRKGTRSLHKTQFSQKRHSFIAQNQKFSPEKTPCIFATRKDVESYSQMPGKRILALEFSNVCPFLEVAPPPSVPESWIRPWVNQLEEATDG
jgi:hypothetical protein